MKRLLAGGLALGLGLWIGGARAGEPFAAAAPARPAGSSFATAGEPSPAPPRPAQAEARWNAARATLPPVPRVSLGRPVALRDDGAPAAWGQATPDPRFRLVSYAGGFAVDAVRPVVGTGAPEPVQSAPVSVPEVIGPPLGPGTPIATPSQAAPTVVAPSPRPTSDGDARPPAAVTWGVGPGVPFPDDFPHGHVLEAAGPPGASPPYIFWARGELLFWGVKDAPLPPLAATGSFGSGTAPAVLLGGKSFDEEEFTGGRVTVGLWCSECKALGFEANILWLNPRTNGFFNGSPGPPDLVVPFQSGGVENAELVAFPGIATGSIGLSTSLNLWGAEANVRCHLGCGPVLCGCCSEADGLAGFRYLQLKEQLALTQSILLLPTATFSLNPLVRANGPAAVLVGDKFATRNSFYGGQLGVETECTHGPWFLDLSGKLAVGSMHETIDIAGVTTFGVAGGFQSLPGGLFAQASNSGHHGRDHFAFVPEVNLKVGYQLGCHVRLFAGYDFLWVSNVLRPGNQIDRNVNLAQVPFPGTPGTPGGPPTLPFKGTDFWAQGLNFGVEFRY